MKKIFFVTTLVLSFIFPNISFAKETSKLSVIVHPDNSISTLSRVELERIYRFKKKNWENGHNIEVVNVRINNNLIDSFSENLLDKDAKYLSKYYLTLAFEGVGLDIKEFNDPKLLKQYISNNINAIGYINTSDVDYSVKVLNIN